MWSNLEGNTIDSYSRCFIIKNVKQGFIGQRRNTKLSLKINRYAERSIR